MRSLALFFALALLATPVLAFDRHLPEEDDDTCTNMAKGAGIFMMARQVGVPLSDLLQRLAHGPDDEAFQVLTRKIIIEAYDTPRFQSKKYREDAAMEYRNKVHVACLKEGWAVEDNYH